MKKSSIRWGKAYAGRKLHLAWRQSMAEYQRSEAQCGPTKNVLAVILLQFLPGRVTAVLPVKSPIKIKFLFLFSGVLNSPK